MHNAQSFDIWQFVSYFNSTRPSDQGISHDLKQALLGPSSTLDSVDFIEFILGLEEYVTKLTGQHVPLFDESWLIDDVVLNLDSVVKLVAKKMDEIHENSNT